MTISDSRLMQNIRDLQNCLAMIQALAPKRIFDTTTSRESMALVGQDAQKVIPELVSGGSDGFMKTDYELLVVPLTGAVQELAAQVVELAAQVKDIQTAQGSASA